MDQSINQSINWPDKDDSDTQSTSICQGKVMLFYPVTVAAHFVSQWRWDCFRLKKVTLTQISNLNWLLFMQPAMLWQVNISCEKGKLRNFCCLCELDLKDFNVI